MEGFNISALPWIWTRHLSLSLLTFSLDSIRLLLLDPLIPPPHPFSMFVSQRLEAVDPIELGEVHLSKIGVDLALTLSLQ
jgi:hypothetical protein